MGSISLVNVDEDSIVKGSKPCGFTTRPRICEGAPPGYRSKRRPPRGRHGRIRKEKGELEILLRSTDHSKELMAIAGFRLTPCSPVWGTGCRG